MKQYPSRKLPQLLLLLGLISLAQVYSRLIVHSPQELKDKFPLGDQRIRASYANFGSIPYGQSLIGRIYYNTSNPLGCKKGNFTDDFSGDPDGILTPIFLVDRGDCSFVTKVRNIEKAGGSLAVIIDNKPTDNIKDLIMSDDGTGAGIRIPSMLISYQDGQILKDYLLNSPPEIAKQASLTAEFILFNQDKLVNWELWYTSSNDKALDFLKYFKERQDEFSDDEVSFKPRIVTWSCPQCDDDFKKKECVSNGAYCSMNHAGQYTQGRDIIMEDLRELCLYEHLTSTGERKKWWAYMERVHEICTATYITEDCSKLGLKYIGVDEEKINQCVTKSFSGSVEGPNSKLLVEQFMWKQYGTGYYPSVVVNNRTLRGDLNPDSVLRAICAGSKTPAKACKTFIDPNPVIVLNADNEGITVPALIVMVTLLIIVNVVLIVLYRKCTNKDIQDDMKLQVNSAVSQYFALSTQNNMSMHQ